MREINIWSVLLVIFILLSISMLCFGHTHQNQEIEELRESLTQKQNK